MSVAFNDMHADCSNIFCINYSYLFQVYHIFNQTVSTSCLQAKLGEQPPLGTLVDRVITLADDFTRTAQCL